MSDGQDVHVEVVVDQIELLARRERARRAVNFARELRVRGIEGVLPHLCVMNRISLVLLKQGAINEHAIWNSGRMKFAVGFTARSAPWSTKTTKRLFVSIIWPSVGQSSRAMMGLGGTYASSDTPDVRKVLVIPPCEVVGRYGKPRTSFIEYRLPDVRDGELLRVR